MHHGPLHVLLAHDPKLVLVAAFVCIAGATAAMALARQSFESRGATRAGWLFLCAVTTGASIWTTHFVAMLSFDPGYDVGYDPALTSLSLFIAVAGAGIGFAAAAATPHRFAALLGGAFLGLSGVAMHFTGMAAVRVPGHFLWDPRLVVASLLTGAILAALSVDVVRGARIRHAEWVGAALFTAAICGLHFTAMAALRFVPDNTTVIPQQLIPNEVLGYIVAGIALLIVGSGFATRLISRNNQAEASARLKNLADAAIEGIVLTDGTQILDVNESFLAIVGARDAASLRGESFWNLVQHVQDMPGSRFEGVVQGAAGAVPVEILARDSRTDSGFRRIYAIRDLTERHEAERQHPLSRASSMRSPACPTAPRSRTGLPPTCASPRAAATTSPLSCSTSTASRRPTTSSAMPPATRCSRPSPRAYRRSLPSAISSPGSAATSSPSCSRRRTSRPLPPRSPRSCST